MSGADDGTVRFALVPEQWYWNAFLWVTGTLSQADNCVARRNMHWAGRWQAVCLLLGRGGAGPRVGGCSGATPHGSAESRRWPMLVLQGGQETEAEERGGGSDSELDSDFYNPTGGNWRP